VVPLMTVVLENRNAWPTAQLWNHLDSRPAHPNPLQKREPAENGRCLAKQYPATSGTGVGKSQFSNEATVSTSNRHADKQRQCRYPGSPPEQLCFAEFRPLQKLLGGYREKRCVAVFEPTSINFSLP